MNNTKLTKTDILKEIGNIGTGNAATSLSIMINKQIIINVPNVEFLDINLIINGMSELKDGDVLISIGIKEALEGHVLLKMEAESAQKLFDAASQGMEIEKNLLLSELANILTGSYMNAIASMIDGFINITTPEFCDSETKMSSLICSNSYAPEVAFIKTAMMINEEQIFCDFILMMTPSSLKFLLERVSN